MKDRVIALAGLLQATESVVALATRGRADPSQVDDLLGSVLRIDAESAAAVYGGTDKLRKGLQLVAAHATGSGTRDSALLKIGLTVLQVERRLAAQPLMLASLKEGIVAAQHAMEDAETPSSVLHSTLGDLYARTISTLTPRVLVQGDPDLLSRSDIVMSIRALLLAAVRSAVLWRQSGGSYWDFFLRRGAIAQEAKNLLR